MSKRKDIKHYEKIILFLCFELLLVRDRSYISDLAPLMNMIPDDEDHPDIVWIRKVEDEYIG